MKKGKQNVIYQKTYPSSLDELEKNGYIKLLSDEDMDNFKYTPKKRNYLWKYPKYCFL